MKGFFDTQDVLPMELKLYLAIIIYFILGAVAFAIIARRKSKDKRKQLWSKYFTYFAIIQILFLSIYFSFPYFTIIALLIVTVGYIELIRVKLKNDHERHYLMFSVSLIVYTLVAIPFVLFSMSEKNILYFTFITVSVFDAFSQISGQLWGKKKLIPGISPGKTVGGLSGGAALAIFSGVLMKGLLGIAWTKALLFAVIITIFAFWGDFFASYYKRQFKEKDFGKSLPGHGGFLDRFDSLIPGGAAMYILNYFLS